MSVQTPQPPAQILVIEDNAPDVLLIAEALNENGLPHQITHYRDGEEALAELDHRNAGERRFDVVILDLNMPRIGGLGVLAQLRNSPAFQRVPFLILTSSLAPDEQLEAKRLGADRYLKKPADLYEFLNEVGSAVREMLASPHDAQALKDPPKDAAS